MTNVEVINALKGLDLNSYPYDEVKELVSKFAPKIIGIWIPKGQLNDYRRVFDKCYLVVEQNEVDAWKDYDEDMGIIAFCHGSRGKISMEEARPAKINERIDVDVLMTCLRADEYEFIADHYGGASLSGSKYKHFAECKEVLRELDYKRQYKACEAFYQIVQEEESCDDSVMCGRFRELYEMIEPSLPESSFVPLHWAVNDMDNAIYEIDIYEPGLFMRIAKRLGEVIEGKWK